MRKPNQLKRMVPLLLPVVLIIGVLFFYYHGKALKASTPDALVSVTVGNEAVQNDSLTTEKETVELTLQAKETDIFELPYDDTVSVTPLDEEGQETTYPQLASSDVKKSQALKLFKERLKTTNTSDSHEAKKEETTKTTEPTETTEDTNKRLPYYQVRETDDKGSFYFELEKEQTQRVRITRLKKKEQTVNLASLTDTSKKQPIVVFKATEQLTKEQPEIPEASEAVEPVGDEKQEEPAEPKTNENEETTEEAKEPAAEKATIKPQASLTDPFGVSVGIGKKTGTKPFDKEIGNEPGYDKDELNDIVRTFDEVSYELTLGISTLDEKYASVRIRLDMELPDAWRKDSSGQVRQAAEFSNGTLVDTGDGTKKSIRSTTTIAEKGSGIQAVFGETIEVFGGVNGWELNPKFTMVIESATLKDGSEVKINQVIDSTVKPELAEQTKVTISAKPLVDVKLAWTKDRMSTFEKVTGTTDKNNTMVTNIAAYVLLKPLPGRSDLTSIKGSTYPEGGIEYTIDQKMIYTNETNNETKELVIGVDTEPMQVIAYDGLTGVDMPLKKFTSEYASYNASYKEVKRDGLAAPLGYTRRVFPPDTEPTTTMGIYDTGNPKAENIISDNAIKITNNDYVPASIGKNKMLLSGGTPLGSNEEPFSVVAMQMIFPYDYLEKQVGVSGNIDYVLSVSEIKYEGDSQTINKKETFHWDRKWPGTFHNYAVFADKNKIGLSSNKISEKNYASYGDGVTTVRNNLWGYSVTGFTDPEADINTMYSRWNANSFKYDSSRTIENTQNSGSGDFIKNYYGVGTKFPNRSLRTKNEIDSLYSWYESVDEALNHGEIVAIKSLNRATNVAGVSVFGVRVPLKGSNKIGVLDSFGNPNILLTNSFNLAKDGKTQTSYCPTDVMPDYRPTAYDENGVQGLGHSPTRSWGDTLYVAGMTIRPNIYTDKNMYTPIETVKWTVDGKVESGSENNHKVQFAVTIPKETQYIDETAKDYQGNPLPDPSSRVENADGTWTLKWVLDYTAEGSTYNPKVTFDTSIISSKLTFISNSAQIDGKVVADVWLEEDESVRDPSDEEDFRTSTANAVVTNSGVIVVDKVVDKPYIESGNEIDPAKPADTHPTDFTYTISFKNHSSNPMGNVRVLDVLPYNGDGRGTDFQGGYSLEDVKQLPGSVKGDIWYTTGPVAVRPGKKEADPNDIVLSSGWSKLGSNMEALKEARAIMAVYDKLDPGEDMSLTLTLRPNGQLAGDKYVNIPSLNSDLSQHVIGVPSSVRVYGRDLSGVAWYDDNLDGLIGNKPSGGAEEWAKDIPVKLYRTSLEVPSYKNKLVEESLTGEPFVNSSGESQIKTDENGKYQFNNLPEGNYLAEFVIGDKVEQREFRVTKKEAGSDESLNSKADQTTYKTKDFAQPILSEVAGLGATDSKNHVEHVNLGLVRPSTIRLFKFATGTAIDGDGDGKLSEAEKATGTPLKNAEFEVYEGDASSPFAKETTDESGNLSFVKLFPGEHTLIETKAPEGYELIKSPIKVTITEGNQTIQVYQEDDKKTDLPFTGGTGPMLLLLIIVSGMGILGLGGLYWYYRQPSRKGEG